MADARAKPLSRRFVIAISVVIIAQAIVCFYVGVTRSPQLNAPPWVAYVLGVMFLAWGVFLLAREFGHVGRGFWLGLIFLAGLASVFWWISLASDPRDCAASIGPLTLPPRACKIGFGFGAALCTASAIYLARVLFFPRRRSYY